jgi:transcriptional regulator with XRE-family HTH domain
VPKPSPSSARDPVLVALGEAVRNTRKAREISQEALADLAGIDRSYVGGVERGEHNLAIMNLRKIATALDVRPSQILEAAGL